MQYYEKKTIKIKFVGLDYLDGKVEYDPVVFDERIWPLLNKHYNVVISNEPDYIICGLFYGHFNYSHGINNACCNYPQIRIFLCDENYIPDFNIIDYAISAYPITFLDRNYYVFGGVGYTRMLRMIEMAEKNRSLSEEDIKKKKYFANFICSHDSEYGIRGAFFKKLSAYKRIEAPGSLFNNTQEKVYFNDGSKIVFQRKCKFTLCFESTKHEGFITEKIIDAFYSDTIPIYYGSSTVVTIFNPKAFINVNSFECFDDAIQEIIKIDSDEQLYLEMINQPIFLDNQYPRKLLEGLEKFICNIFDQPIEDAYRRSRCYSPNAHESFLKEAEKRVYKWEMKKYIIRNNMLRILPKKAIDVIKKQKRNRWK